MQTASKNPLIGVVITIDGPTSSGKGTLAKKLSAKYKMKYLDTGTLYRTLTYAAAKANVNWQDTEGLVKLAQNLDYDFKHVGNNNFATFLNDENIESKIRTPDVDRNVHYIATNNTVRDAIRHTQTSFAEKWKDVYGVILDGRDTGARIYPNAQIQLFIAGDANIRAEWRTAQQQGQGINVNYETVLADLQKRDERDAPNTIQTPTAHIIKVTDMTPEAVEQTAVKIVDTFLNV